MFSFRGSCSTNDCTRGTRTCNAKRIRGTARKNRRILNARNGEGRGTERRAANVDSDTCARQREINNARVKLQFHEDSTVGWTPRVRVRFIRNDDERQNATAWQPRQVHVYARVNPRPRENIVPRRREICSLLITPAGNGEKKRPKT